MKSVNQGFSEINGLLESNKAILINETSVYEERERKDSSLRKLQFQEVHNRIRKIAENKEFKTLKNYIRFFSKNDKVKKCLKY